MAQDKQLIKANKKVNKALGVFTKAVAEVEKAQDVLEEGVSRDYREIDRIRGTINTLLDEIDAIEESKKEKEVTIVANDELLVKLNQFKPE